MSASPSRLLTADGRELKEVLKKHKARQKRKAFLLVAPLLAFVLVGFCLPILDMLRRSTDNSIVEETLPRTVLALKDWEAGGEALPNEQAFKALAQDLVLAQQRRRATRLGQRLNYEFSGMASLFRRSGRNMEELVHQVRATRGSYKEALIAFDARWGEVDSWRVLKRFSGGVVGDYYLASFDMKRDLQSNEVSLRPSDERIYLRLFGRTIMISLGITLATLLLGFPLALWIARLPTHQGNILLVMVLLPFWTSLLVRTTSWIVLLQQQGVINDLLVAFGIISEEGRLRMIYNTTGTVIAMTHILVAFHGVAALQRDEDDFAFLHACCHLVGRASYFCLLEGVFSEHDSWHRSGSDHGVHPCDRLLHHARVGRRQDGSFHQQSYCLSHFFIAELGPCGGVGRCLAWLRGCDLLALRQNHRHRQHQAGVAR